jgi:hypothetical protein
MEQGDDYDYFQKSFEFHGDQLKIMFKHFFLKCVKLHLNATSSTALYGFLLGFLKPVLFRARVYEIFTFSDFQTL